MNLWHVSDRSDIRRFEPRVPPGSAAATGRGIVWAIAESHLANYLLPRECPRVCMRVAEHTAESDRIRFFGQSTANAIVVVEASWSDRASSLPIWLYGVPESPFICIDANAGYYASPEPVVPISVRKIESPSDELRAMGAELRVVERLRPLAEEVAASTLAFSIIRLRNAA